MASEVEALKDNLKKAGLSRAAIDAAWPAWWSREAEQSSSARAELRFSLARKLGLSPASLFDDHVQFVWRDEARFKHLKGESDTEKAALASFGTSVGRILLRAAPEPPPKLPKLDAQMLRQAILSHHGYVELKTVIAMAWAFGVPVVYLRVFPLTAKRMHAMVVKSEGRYAILLGRDSNYPAPVAFTLAHELGHVACGHLDGAEALVEVGDPATTGPKDGEEGEADRWALTLLTGSAEPVIRPDRGDFNAPTLAAAAIKAGPEYRIEPGALALCEAHQSGVWARGMAAMKFIYANAEPAWPHVNQVAARALRWDQLSEDSAEFLANVLGLTHG